MFTHPPPPPKKKKNHQPGACLCGSLAGRCCGIHLHLPPGEEDRECAYVLKDEVLKGSWDLVTRVINKVAIVIVTYNPIRVLIAVLTKSHEPPSR